MRILLSGGGTAGSVSPLISIKEELQSRNLQAEFLFIGTLKGQPEKDMLSDIKYQGMISAKWRRYFSWQNLLAPFLFLIAICQSVFIIAKFKPDIVLSAGSFVSVPLIWTAKLMGVPSLIHQQDVRPGLANKLMSPWADKITVTFKKSLLDFPNKSVWTGNPVRQALLNVDKNKALETLKLNKNLPVLLIMGGGTGALDLNKIIVQSLPELTQFCQVIHLTGKDKKIDFKNKFNNYQSYEFLKEKMGDAYAVADIVISRAGLSSLTELSVLQKITIMIPMPQSHQEDNAQILADNQAGLILNQNNLTPQILINEIKNLLQDKNRQLKYKKNISQLIKPQAEKLIVNEILKLI
ncbi:MAG: undecaprenyldiphospho-muramoylpentapeptide beta-N-acetylglucosaminyltransferase [Patescibacteria group bacterium]|nr:undecaprenyldiphospho-muramoylpentapeptide beta-N-acetylglucosaminyltransferase [Patescibacteria group bacterium]